MSLRYRRVQPLDGHFPETPQVPQRTVALEAGAAVELEPVHVTPARQRRRERGRRRAVDSVHVRAHGSGDVHQAGVVRDRLLGVTEQVDDVLERRAAAEVVRGARRRDLLAGRRILVGTEYPDVEALVPE